MDKQILTVMLGAGEPFALREQDGREFINWHRAGVMVVDRPAYGAEAKLVAVVADLLAACEGVLEVVDLLGERNPIVLGRPTLDRLRAAVARATGAAS